MVCVPETAASYGRKSALVLDEPVYKHGCARDRIIDRKEGREPAKMFGCLLGGSADNRHIQVSAD